MQGNQLMTPQGRMLFAAAAFAVLAFVALLLVWKWPGLFGRDAGDAVPQRELTVEEKLDVLEQVQASSVDTGPQISEEEKQDVLEQVAASSETSVSAELSEEEKLDVLDSLNNP